jgi:hypothetical protein
MEATPTVVKSIANTASISSPNPPKDYKITGEPSDNKIVIPQRLEDDDQGEGQATRHSFSKYLRSDQFDPNPNPSFNYPGPSTMINN